MYKRQEPAATGSQTDTEDTQNMENAEDTGEQDWAGEEESSDPAPVETDPPVWEGPETVVYLAPYDALSVEYGGYFYYVDRDDNLCRTTTDMTDYTLFCEAQIRGDVRIIGITDAGRMYMSSGGPVSYTHLDVYKRQPLHRAHGAQCEDRPVAEVAAPAPARQRRPPHQQHRRYHELCHAGIRPADACL